MSLLVLIIKSQLQFVLVAAILSLPVAAGQGGGDFGAEIAGGVGVFEGPRCVALAVATCRSVKTVCQMSHRPLSKAQD